MYKWFFYSSSHLRFENRNLQTIVNVDCEKLYLYRFYDLGPLGVEPKMVVGEDYETR